MKDNPLHQLTGLFEATHQHLQKQASRSVDTALVVRNWLFGYYIVEFEQGAADRAELYGRKLLPHLSQKLKDLGLKGLGVTNLKQCRSFYQNYSEMGQTASDPSLPSKKIHSGVSEISRTLSDSSILCSPTEREKLDHLVTSLYAGMKLNLTPLFKKSLKKFTKKWPKLISRVIEALDDPTEESYQPKLKTHVSPLARKLSWSHFLLLIPLLMRGA